MERKKRPLQRGGAEGQDNEKLNRESNPNALLHNTTNLKDWLRAVPVR